MSPADVYREELAEAVWFEYYTHGEETELFHLLANEQDRVGYFIGKQQDDLVRNA